MDESIGAKLRQARERRLLNLQQVSESTKIRPHYLQALENDDLSAIPSAAQARGFLGIYAGFLGLDLHELVPAVRPAESNPPVAASSVLPARETPNPEAAPHFGIREWASVRWSKLAGKPTREVTAASPDRPAQSETSKTDPSPQGEASKPGSSAQSEAPERGSSAQSGAPERGSPAPSEVLQPGSWAPSEPSVLVSSTQSKAWSTDPGESISSTPAPGNEQVEKHLRIPPPLKSRIQQMFLDTTVERASASDQTPPQPDSGAGGADLGAGSTADKKKAGA